MERRRDTDELEVRLKVHAMTGVLRAVDSLTHKKDEIVPLRQTFGQHLLSLLPDLVGGIMVNDSCGSCCRFMRFDTGILLNRAQLDEFIRSGCDRALLVEYKDEDTKISGNDKPQQLEIIDMSRVLNSSVQEAA
jgi:hypothetical protein